MLRAIRPKAIYEKWKPNVAGRAQALMHTVLTNSGGTGASTQGLENIQNNE